MNRFPKSSGLRLLVIGSVLFALCLLVAFPPLSGTRPGVTWSNYERIESGMTQAEVDAVFGRKGFPIDMPVLRGKGWYHGSGWFTIYFDDDWKVREKRWWPDGEPTIWDRFRKWLGR